MGKDVKSEASFRYLIALGSSVADENDAFLLSFLLLGATIRERKLLRRLGRLKQKESHPWLILFNDFKNVLFGSCAKYQEFLDVWESLFVPEAGDWRQPCFDFLQHRYCHQIVMMMEI